MAYRLSVAAAQDVIEIHARSIELFGPRQADAYHDRLIEAFGLIAANPAIARERTEITPPVRVHPVGTHLVIYVESGPDVLVVRVRHAREDWTGDTP